MNVKGPSAVAPLLVLIIITGWLEAANGERLPADRQAKQARCREAVAAVEAALLSPDDTGKRALLVQAVGDALLSSDEAVRSSVCGFLERFPDRHVVNFLLFDQISAECRALNTRYCLEDQIDLFELEHSPRSQRIQVYRDAIVQDGVVLWRGTDFPRLSGMAWAVADGADDLRGVIAANHSFLSGEDQLRFPLLQFETELDLKKGAQDFDDALKLAAKRLSAMPEEQLDKLMSEDEAFRHVVFGVAQRACAKGARQTACIAIRGLAAEFRDRDQASQDSTNTTPQRRRRAFGLDPGPDAPWWERLAAHATTPRDRLAF